MTIPDDLRSDNCSFSKKADSAMKNCVAVLLMVLSLFAVCPRGALGTVEPVQFRWTSTLGPPGGLGYDTRIDPRDPDIVYTTDQWAGMCKSYDGGYTWYPRNEGISSRFGPSLDSVPIFCCTIDPYDSNIVWCGTYGMRGVYKSFDKGESWVKMDRGIPDLGAMSFRSFTIDPDDTNIVYTGVEVPVIGQNKSRGMIFKTIDGGDNWFMVLECDALVRYIVIDPEDTDVVYTATGIFDRWDVVPEGILKSDDGGATWYPINDGIDNLVVGGLTMHPFDHNTLFCATGRHEGFGPEPEPRDGRILKTVDGGQSWTEIGPAHRCWNAVEVDRSDPDIIYASCEWMFARSYDGGASWETMPLGLSDVYSGVPIMITIDPINPDKVFVNSYTGGLYLSLDAGATWMNAMNGFTGAELTDIALDPNSPSVVFAVGRPGPFKSLDGGLNWLGTGGMFGRQPRPEWSAVCVKPDEPDIVLAADQFYGELYRTLDRGESWETVLVIIPVDQVEYPLSLHGIKTIAFAPSDPSVVYAGARIPDKTIEFDRTTPYDTTRPSVGVHKSMDGGVTWVQMNDGLENTTKNINEIVVHPHDPDIAYATTLNSGVYMTLDGGGHWIGINSGITRMDVRSIAIDPNNPDVLYAGAENSGVFKTENGGLSWRQVNVGLDAEATIRGLVVDPVNSSRVYAGDWHTGAYVSEDAGGVWIHINEGLENRAITALDISADGSVLYAATQGGGVFRLGDVATKGTLMGRVLDAVTLEPVQSALVALDSTATTVRTDTDGNFTIENLPASIYSLDVSASTYKSYHEDDILLIGGQTRTTEITLCRRQYPALFPVVNGTVFVPGDTLRLDARLEHKGPSVHIDVYLAIDTPGGLLFFDGLGFTSDIVGFPLFVMTGTDLLFQVAEMSVTEHFPPGQYVAYGAATVSGAYELYSATRATSFEIAASQLRYSENR